MRPETYQSRFSRRGRQLNELFINVRVLERSSPQRRIVRSSFKTSKINSFQSSQHIETPTPERKKGQGFTEVPIGPMPDVPTPVVLISNSSPACRLSSPMTIHGHEFRKILKPRQQHRSSKKATPPAIHTRRNGFFASTKVRKHSSSSTDWDELERSLADETDTEPDGDLDGSNQGREESEAPEPSRNQERRVRFWDDVEQKLSDVDDEFFLEIDSDEENCGGGEGWYDATFERIDDTTTGVKRKAQENFVSERGKLGRSRNIEDYC